MKTILSIIIPAYNAEKTIGYCLESLADHTQYAAEIIVVNDGSQDSTEDICNRFIQRGYRLRLFSQSNSGISAARNLALRHACGKYFTFVDADDYVSADFCRVMTQCLQSEEYDVLWFGTNQTKQYTPYKAQSNTSTVFPLSSEELTHIQSIPLYYDYKLNQPDSHLRGISPSTAWGSVFRRKIQADHQIFFSDKVLLYEDGIFNLNMLHYCKKSGFISLCLYQYMINSDSVTNRFRTDWQEKFSVRNAEIIRLLTSEMGISMDNTESIFIQRYYGSIVFQAKVILDNQIFSRNNPIHISERIRQCRTLLRNPLYRQCLSKCHPALINPDEQQILKYLKRNNAVYTWSSYEYQYRRHQLKLWLISLRRTKHA